MIQLIGWDIDFAECSSVFGLAGAKEIGAHLN
jgi:hypothetical protein